MIIMNLNTHAHTQRYINVINDVYSYLNYIYILDYNCILVVFLPSTFHIIESLIRLVDQTETGAAPFGLVFWLRPMPIMPGVSCLRCRLRMIMP
jgi:hypothetical protein